MVRRLRFACRDDPAPMRSARRSKSASRCKAALLSLHPVLTRRGPFRLRSESRHSSRALRLEFALDRLCRRRSVRFESSPSDHASGPIRAFDDDDFGVHRHRPGYRFLIDASQNVHFPSRSWSSSPKNSASRSALSSLIDRSPRKNRWIDIRSTSVCFDNEFTLRPHSSIARRRRSE